MNFFDDFLSCVEKRKIKMNTAMVVQDGKVLGMHRSAGHMTYNVFSIAKSYTSAAIGFAVDEGILKLTDRPYEMFSDVFQSLSPEQVDSRWQKVTLFHLLTMTSGHGKPHLMAADRKMLRGETEGEADPAMKKEWLRFAFTRPMAHEPGEVFRYGNLAPYVSGRMLEKMARCTVCDYLYEKMWKPLGIEKPRWDTDLAGHTFTASELYLDIEDMTRLGQIYLGRGQLGGRRFLSEEWIRLATANYCPTTAISPKGYGADEMCGYGFYLWHNTYAGSYRAYGKEGQFIIVLPDKNAVVAIQAEHSDVQEILDIVWKKILTHL